MNENICEKWYKKFKLLSIKYAFPDSQQGLP
jgi:hypothetical protein